MLAAGRVARAGRSGRALSLLTRDELPYLLDLHLFLSRPLEPAPVASLADACEAADLMDPSASLYGCFPQVQPCELWVPICCAGRAGRGCVFLPECISSSP